MVLILGQSCCSYPFFLLQDQNVFDSKKKVKLTNADGVEYKLAKKQLQAIEFNKALLAMYTNQVSDLSTLTLQLYFDT